MSDTEQEDRPVEPDAPLAPVEPEPGPEDVPEPEEPVEPQEPPQESEPEQASDEVMKERVAALQKLEKHVARRMSEIFGEEATLWEECEVCSYTNTPGWRPQGLLLPDVANALYTLLGQRPPSELRKDKHSNPCEDCGGEGFVATLSKVTGQESLPCVECKSMGWLPTDDARQPPPGFAMNGLTPSSPPPSPGSSAPPAPLPEDPPEVAALKAQGYAVIAPYVVPA